MQQCLRMGLRRPQCWWQGSHPQRNASHRTITATSPSTCAPCHAVGSADSGYCRELPWGGSKRVSCSGNWIVGPHLPYTASRMRRAKRFAKLPLACHACKTSRAKEALPFCTIFTHGWEHRNHHVSTPFELTIKSLNPAPTLSREIWKGFESPETSLPGNFHHKERKVVPGE